MRSAAVVLRPLAGLLLVAFANGACSRPSHAGEALPSFRLGALDGRQLGPLDFRGKVVLYDFWATWCGPYHVQAEVLHALCPAYAAKDVEFLAVSVGEPEEVVREFVRERPHPYPVLLDPADELTARLGIQALPTLMVVDRRGKVAYFQPGVADADTLRKVFAAAGV